MDALKPLTVLAAGGIADGRGNSCSADAGSARLGHGDKVPSIE